MANLPKCSEVGCESPVSKAGYTLCYKHWLIKSKNKDVPKVEKTETENILQSNFLTSTALGEKLGIDGRKVNQVLSELGWIERAKKAGFQPHKVKNYMQKAVKVDNQAFHL